MLSISHYYNMLQNDRHVSYHFEILTVQIITLTVCKLITKNKSQHIK